LKVVWCNGTELDETLEANRKHPGFLKLIVELDTPRVGLAERVRKICPQALMIEPRYLKAQPEKRPESQEASQFDAVAEFRRYWCDRQEKTPPPLVLQAFEKLYQELSDATP
jgi:exonuclease SbcD